MLEHIKAGGKERPYLLSYRALKKLTGATNGNLDSIEQAAYQGFYSGHYKENPGVQPDFKFEDIENWFDDDMDLFLKVKKDILSLTDKLTEGIEPGKLQEAIKEAEKKETSGTT